MERRSPQGPLTECASTFPLTFIQFGPMTSSAGILIYTVAQRKAGANAFKCRAAAKRNGRERFCIGGIEQVTDSSTSQRIFKAAACYDMENMPGGAEPFSARSAPGAGQCHCAPPKAAAPPPPVYHSATPPCVHLGAI